MVRVAIALRAARPGDAMPDETFVAELHEQLAATSEHFGADERPPAQLRRGRGGVSWLPPGWRSWRDFVVTELSSHDERPAVRDGVLQGRLSAPRASRPRSAGRGQSCVSRRLLLGVYERGRSTVNGTVRRELHLANGEVVAAGTVLLDDGSGGSSTAFSWTPERSGATLYDFRVPSWRQRSSSDSAIPRSSWTRRGVPSTDTVTSLTSRTTVLEPASRWPALARSTMSSYGA